MWGCSVLDFILDDLLESGSMLFISGLMMIKYILHIGDHITHILL